MPDPVPPVPPPNPAIKAAAENRRLSKKLPPLVVKTREEFLRLCVTDPKYKQLEREMREAVYESHRARGQVIKRRKFLWDLAETEILKAHGYTRPPGSQSPRPDQLTRLLKELLGEKDPTVQAWPASQEAFMDAEEGTPLDRAKQKYQRRLKREKAEAALSEPSPPVSESPPDPPQ